MSVDRISRIHIFRKFADYLSYYIPTDHRIETHMNPFFNPTVSYIKKTNDLGCHQLDFDMMKEYFVEELQSLKLSSDVLEKLIDNFKQFSFIDFHKNESLTHDLFKNLSEGLKNKDILKVFVVFFEK